MTTQKNPSEDEADRRNADDIGVHKTLSVLCHDGQKVDRGI